MTIKAICAYCKTLIRDGTEPVSHGICEACFPVVMAEVDGVSPKEKEKNMANHRIAYLASQLHQELIANDFTIQECPVRALLDFFGVADDEVVSDIEAFFRVLDNVRESFNDAAAVEGIPSAHNIVPVASDMLKLSEALSMVEATASVVGHEAASAMTGGYLPDSGGETKRAADLLISNMAAAGGSLPSGE